MVRCGYQLVGVSALLLITISASPAPAVDTLRVTSPDPVTESWRWTEFDRNDGLVGLTLNLYGDRDGNIWIATDQGVQRYDGYRWRTFTTEDGLAHNHVQTVYQTRDGAMWFGTLEGINRFDGKTWATYTTEDGLPTNSVHFLAIHQARDGTLWAGFETFGDTTRAKGGIARFDGTAWSAVDVPVGRVPRPGIRNIVQAADGALWFLTQAHGVLRFDPSAGSGAAAWNLYDGAEQVGLWRGGGWGLSATEDGSIWVGGSYIGRFRDGEWRVYRERDGLERGYYGNIWQAPDGALWTGGPGRLYRLRGDRWEPSEPTGFARAYTWGTAMPDGTVWHGRWRGRKVIRFDPSGVSTSYLHPDTLRGGLETADGAVWFHTRARPQAVRLKDGVWLGYTPEDGFLDESVGRMFYWATGDEIWAKGRHGGQKAYARYGGDAWSLYTEEDGVPPGESRFLETPDGGLWLVGIDGDSLTACRYRGQVWERVGEAPVPADATISTSHAATDGTLWTSVWATGSSEPYVYRFDGQAWDVYGKSEGLQDWIHDMEEWPDGTLWFGTVFGLARVELSAPSDAEAWWHKRDFPGPRHWKKGFRALLGAHNALWFAPVPYWQAGAYRYDGRILENYTAADGLASNGVDNIIRASDGAVWFTSRQGLTRFDGTSFVQYAADDGTPVQGGARRVTIRESRDGSFWVDSGEGQIIHFRCGAGRAPPETFLESGPEQVSSVGNILLAWGGRDLWDETPQADLRYQWRLDEGGWSRPTGARHHTFTALSGGSHSLEVRAVDRDGNSDASPAVHTFIVEPPWWRNPWGLSLAAVLLALVGAQTARLVRRDQRLKASNAELTVEAALERVRAKALEMEGFDDLKGVSETIFHELAGLDLDLVRTGTAVERGSWVAQRKGGETAVEYYPPVPGPSFQDEYDRMREAFSRGDPYCQWELQGEQLAARQREVARQYPGQMLSAPDHDREVHYRLFFGGEDRDAGGETRATGYLSLVSEDELPGEDIETALRFAKLFGFAYDRYLELEEKGERNRQLEEANRAMSDANKELFAVNQALTRDRAVERIRGEVQAMEQASDFERVLSLLAEDLETVGLSFDTCGIEVLAEPVDAPTLSYSEQYGYRYTAYTIDPDGAVASSSYSISAPFPPVNLEAIERFIAGQPWRARTEQNAIVEVPTSGYGHLRLTSSDRDEFTDEDVEALKDFAAAIALGYARYLDIREIQEQTQRKSAFLASMAHDLRTPMNAIKGFTNLVLGRRSENLTDRQRGNLETVSQASDHLLAMINDLLDLSKIEAGRMDVSPERFDVKGLVSSCCATVSPLFAERPDVELGYDVPDTVGEADTDQARVRQMLINLLSNAVKFTDTGSVTVRASREAGDLVIAVADTGKGIPADEIDTIFDEYRQVKGSDVGQQGTGLGLSITRKFAELLGGSISVHSEVGKGSTFTVRMPASYRSP